MPELPRGKNTILQGKQGWLVDCEINLERVNGKSISNLFFLFCLLSSYHIPVNHNNDHKILFSEWKITSDLLYHSNWDTCWVTSTWITDLCSSVDAGYVQRPLQIAPFGSMSYLCSSPHYFSPEEVICSLHNFVFLIWFIASIFW